MLPFYVGREDYSIEIPGRAGEARDPGRRAGERSEPAPAGPGSPLPLDLITYRTSDLVDGGKARDAGRGYLLDRRTGKVIAVPEPWQVRVSRCKRALDGWLDAVWPLVESQRCYMIRQGLTLAPEVEWKDRLISGYMARVRKELRRSLVDYFWVAEMQARGAVHYHVLLLVRTGHRVPLPDRAGWWLHGSSSVVVVSNKQGAKYLVRGYLGKDKQKGGPGGPSFPTGLRMYGMRLGKNLDPLRRLLVRLALLPEWLRQEVFAEAVTIGYGPRRRKGGGGWWFHGRVLCSPWGWASCAVDLR